LVDRSADLGATTAVIRRFWSNSCLIWPLTLGFGSLFPLRWCEETQRYFGETCESQDFTLAVIGVAIMIAVEEPGSDFSQIACPDWLTAQHTRGLFARRPVIHQYEFHAAPPSAKQNTASDGWKAFGGGSTEVICVVGLSLFNSTFPAESEMYFPSLPGSSRLRSISLAGILDTLSPAIGFSE
jgi:hypothetical protein